MGVPFVRSASATQRFQAKGRHLFLGNTSKKQMTTIVGLTNKDGDLINKDYIHCGWLKGKSMGDTTYV